MFDLLGKVLERPVRLVVDIVEAPIKILNSDYNSELFSHTAKGMQNIDDEMESGRE